MTGTEREILIRSQAGDLGAFRELVEHYQPYALSVAYRMLGNKEDSKDVVQESFIQVWKHLPGLKMEMKFTTWLYRIVMNRCLDRIKARKRFKRHLEERNVYAEHFQEPEMDTGQDNRGLVDVIGRLAMTLTPKQRMVFVLRDLEDRSIGEVSGILKMSKNSVKSNLYHARRQIRHRLQALKILEKERI